MRVYPFAWDTPSQATVLNQNEDLLVVDKPAGWLTHPDGERARPDVVSHFGGGLGVHHRLDVDTSGVLAFSRSPAGARQLSEAFERGGVVKTYLAVVAGHLGEREGVVRGPVPEAPGRDAETRWRVVGRGGAGGAWTLIEAQPMTGRTHQIRAHLAKIGHPILGDLRYGDPLDGRAPRLMLHAWRLELATNALRERFEAPPPAAFARFVSPGAAGRTGLRAELAASVHTNAYRLVHEAADACPGLRVDRYGDWLWVQRDVDADASADAVVSAFEARGVYQIDGVRDRSRGQQAPPRLVRGEAAPEALDVVEAGVHYRVRLGAGDLSTGLFLDQRDRRAWLARHAGGMSVLNTFAHAGGFSVAAAVGGAARTVSVDLDRAWLARVGPQLEINGVTPDAKRHDTIYGDVFDWLKRLAKRGERFDLVIVDPPSTSVGADGKRFSAGRDYAALAALAAPLVAPGGGLWTITNHRATGPAAFAKMVAHGLGEAFELERAWPMPIDHPEDAAGTVKTLVWRRRS